MKALITAGAVLAIAGAASATDFNLPVPDLAGGEGASFPVTLPVDTTAMDISFEITGISGSASWASDVQFIVSDAGGTVYTIGGFTNAGDQDIDWAFAGSGSTDDGFYSDSFALALPAGDYTLTVVNDWDSASAATMSFPAGMDVVFTKVPTPGAAGLLGLAGLAAVRRRR